MANDFTISIPYSDWNVKNVLELLHIKHFGLNHFEYIVAIKAIILRCCLFEFNKIRLQSCDWFEICRSRIWMVWIDCFDWNKRQCWTWLKLFWRWRNKRSLSLQTGNLLVNLHRVKFFDWSFKVKMCLIGELILKVRVVEKHWTWTLRSEFQFKNSEIS